MNRSARRWFRSAPLCAAWCVGFTTLLSTACATDESAPARMEARPVPVAPEARRVEAAPATTAGPAADGGTEDGGALAPRRDAKVDTAFIYNRVLAKLNDPGFDLAKLEAQVEARTGASVKEIKKGPMGLLSIVFDDVKPPRGEAEQRKLVAQLKEMPELRYAEPERLLQAR